MPFLYVARAAPASTPTPPTTRSCYSSLRHIPTPPLLLLLQPRWQRHSYRGAADSRTVLGRRDPVAALRGGADPMATLPGRCVREHPRPGRRPSIGVDDDEGSTGVEDRDCGARGDSSGRSKLRRCPIMCPFFLSLGSVRNETVFLLHGGKLLGVFSSLIWCISRGWLHHQLKTNSKDYELDASSLDVTWFAIFCA
jgi:hypothetical protein